MPEAVRTAAREFVHNVVTAQCGSMVIKTSTDPNHRGTGVTP
jgi:hypothetical protein